MLSLSPAPQLRGPDPSLAGDQPCDVVALPLCPSVGRHPVPRGHTPHQGPPAERRPARSSRAAPPSSLDRVSLHFILEQSNQCATNVDTGRQELAVLQERRMNWLCCRTQGSVPWDFRARGHSFYRSAAAAIPALTGLAHYKT
ncbi:hypothetical protein U9M48_013547 [Paspalum notatum var. saurae]|uniref:Uncharacterized protein n=1 Tax=Paspalum notatum var. saurae TaxID=547442 RepID=A0AAQ3SZP0_PASNO